MSREEDVSSMGKTSRCDERGSRDNRDAFWTKWIVCEKQNIK